MAFDRFGWSCRVMRVLKSTALGAALLSFVAVAALAQEQALAPYGAPAPVATTPGTPYSSARVPGPKIGPSNWIPGSSAAQTAPGAAPSTDSEYSSKGFGT